MRGWLGTILVAATVLPLGGGAHRRTEEGNRLYLDGLYEDALRTYTEAQVAAPEAPELYYDIGNVLYRQNDYAGAAEAYTRALLSASSELEGPAAFNLGNARYRLEAYDEAAKAYQRSLLANPSDVDSKRNLELALRALEQQQQQPRDGDRQQDPGEQQQDSGEQPEPSAGNTGEEQSESGQQDSGQEQEPGAAAGTPPPEGGSGAGREATAGEMTAEQAERLLDNLEEQELSDLRRLAAREARSETQVEKDW